MLLLETGLDQRRVDMPVGLRAANFFSAVMEPGRIWPNLRATRTADQPEALYVRGRGAVARLPSTPWVPSVAPSTTTRVGRTSAAARAGDGPRCSLVPAGRGRPRLRRQHQSRPRRPDSAVACHSTNYLRLTRRCAKQWFSSAIHFAMTTMLPAPLALAASRSRCATDSESRSATRTSSRLGSARISTCTAAS